jgi:hypothetical protein
MDYAQPHSIHADLTRQEFLSRLGEQHIQRRHASLATSRTVSAPTRLFARWYFQTLAARLAEGRRGTTRRQNFKRHDQRV